MKAEQIRQPRGRRYGRGFRGWRGLHRCWGAPPVNIHYTPPLHLPGAVPPPVLMVVLRRAAAAAVLRSASPSVCCIHSISCLLAAVSPIHRLLLWRDYAHRTHCVLLLLPPHSGGVGGARGVGADCYHPAATRHNGISRRFISARRTLVMRSRILLRVCQPLLSSHSTRQRRRRLLILQTDFYFPEQKTLRN